MQRYAVPLFLVGALLLGARSASSAQDEAALTLDQALTEALARNPALAVERLEIDIARGVRRQAGIYPFNPELEGDGEAGRARDRVEPDVRRNVYGGGVGISQVIWIKGQRGLRIRGAEAGLIRATRLVEDAERQVVGDVLRTYGDLLVSQERLALARETLDLARQVGDAAQKLFEADTVPQLDVFRADVEVRRAQNRVIGQERALATVQRELALLLGRPPEPPLQAVAPSPVLPSPAIGLDGLQAEALARRPDLKATLAGIDVARAEVDLVGAERFFPEVKLGVKYETAREFDSVNRRGLLTLAIPLPLFNRRQGDLERARAELARQLAQVELVRRRLEKEVSIAARQVASSQRIVEEYVRGILPGLERNFGLLRESYELGESRITDVFVGQQQYIEVREAYLDAVGGLNAAIADLYRAVNARP